MWAYCVNSNRYNRIKIYLQAELAKTADSRFRVKSFCISTFFLKSCKRREVDTLSNLM